MRSAASSPRHARSHAQQSAPTAGAAKAEPRSEVTGEGESADPLDACKFIVSLSAGWDAAGSLGPKPPYRWRTVARLAMDVARYAVLKAERRSEAAGECSPGPWRVEENRRENNYQIESSSPHLSATVAVVLGRIGSPTGLADSILIAAAPELLEAAKQVIAWPTVGTPGHEPFEALRVAIARAEGRR